MQKIYQLVVAALAGGAAVGLLLLVLLALSGCSSSPYKPYPFLVRLEIDRVGDTAGTLRLFTRDTETAVKVQAGTIAQPYIHVSSDESAILAQYTPFNGETQSATCKITIPPPPGYILRYRLEVGDRLTCTQIATPEENL